MDQEEQALISRATHGEMAAFEQLVTRYEQQIYGLVLKLTNDPADAIEIVQDVFLTVYTKLRTFKGEAAFASWLYRIAVNAAYMKLRARKRHVEVSLKSSLPTFTDDDRLRPDIADWSQIPEAIVIRGEAAQHLQNAIAQLPPDYRLAFVLREMEGLSHKEIGEVMELGIPAVKSRLHRAALFTAATCYVLRLPLRVTESRKTAYRRFSCAENRFSDPALLSQEHVMLTQLGKKHGYG